CGGVAALSLHVDEGVNEAIYLYGFVPEGTAAPSGELAGIGGAPVEVVAVEGFCAAFGRVPSDEYGAEAVERRLRDLDWVGEQGLRHERVVAWFVDRGAIVPVRLLTLYGSLESLRRDAAGRAVEIREQLRRLADRRE